MFHLFFSDDKAWFAQKQVGYGAGWPIAWQGWVLMVSYAALMIGLGTLAERVRDEALVGVIAGMALATVGFVAVAKARTQGGWRWRGRVRTDGMAAARREAWLLVGVVFISPALRTASLFLLAWSA